MADDTTIILDEQGHPRQFKVANGSTALAGATPQDAAAAFLAAHADVLKLGSDSMRGLTVRAAVAPSEEAESLRFESESRIMDSSVVSYSQTMFGLPIFGAGISVTTRHPDNAVTAAHSTLHYNITAKRPNAALADLSAGTAANGSMDDVVRKALPAAQGLRINHTRMLVYCYDAKRRTQAHPPHPKGVAFDADPPALQLGKLSRSIKDGTYYVVVEALFTATTPESGVLNWQAFIEPDSGAVLRLRALVDGVTGMVFDRDPITKTGNVANGSAATAAVLDPLRDTVNLQDLGPAAAGTQSLSGTFVRVAEVTLPTVAAPTTVAPFNFAYGSRTNNFSAVNAYYHCDRFFRTVRDLGFNIATYFDGTAFPVPIDHRGKGTAVDLGNIVNADCRGNALSNGIGSVNFALANNADVANPIGIATDARVVLHEIGGHGILWDHVNSPNFGFSHSAGDSIAAIFHDPDTQAPDRFLTFPFPIWPGTGLPLDRRHDRPVNGWGWGGVHDDTGYGSEQILSTSQFRVYRSIGGDSAWQPNRLFASRAMIYLILRGVGQLTPATNSPSATAWEGQLETADAGTWTSTTPAETNSGGAYHKVIRWAFEKQGCFRASGAAVTVAGVPPAVDVYIDDGRAGEYPYLANHWSCTDIWNRLAVGAGGGVHQEPVVGQTNFAYVRIKNRGTQAATNVVVKGFHCLPGVGLVYPTDWLAMTTPQLSAPNLAAADAVGEIVGPFQWTPSQVGHECMFFSVSASGDASNIDGGLTGPIQEWRLVPNDNNIGQRNVHPVNAALSKVAWEKLPFWVRNHNRNPVKLGVTIKVPVWLAKLGWTFDIPAISREGVAVKPGELRQVALTMTAGKPYTAIALAKASDRDIVVTIVQDGLAVGGMTFRITPPGKQ